MQLTGLFNRGETEKRFESELQRVRRGDDSMAVIMLDIDDFKQINDTYGHAAGDYTLKGIAHIINKTVREYDVIGRWGGEEFLIVLYGADERVASRIANLIRSEIADAHFHNGISVTASFGVSVARNDETASQLYKRVDDALYKAKHQGKNMIVVK